jgi:tetratricopeptide (TPR) repeat protein/transcriptional regulator with XRE-family HTH domain
MTDDTAAFGKRLSACRRSALLSQQELAERSGLSIRTIGSLERGRTSWPHLDSVRRLADALQLHDQARVDFVAAAGGPAARGAPLLADRTSQGLRGIASNGQIVPRQLPSSVPQFVGRAEELAALTAMMGSAEVGAPAAVVVTALGGTAGVGKTTLAVRWARQVADRFPDGQLYVNLRGFGPAGRPMLPAEAVRCLLEGLQVRPERIPGSLDAQVGLYRSLLSGRRMLVLLDNARDASQVRPLLPGSPGCLALITSRRKMHGLVATEGAQQLILDVLTEAEAAELLALRLGAGRLAAEPGAAAELATLCARLPLALNIAAARALSLPALGLAALAEELRDSRGRLDALETGDPAVSVRALFSWSVGCASAPAARMFRILGLHPGPDITVSAAASMAEVPARQAGQALAELADAHLITEHEPGRFAMHDLLRVHAAELAGRLAEAERRAAIHRMLDHYLHTAYTASFLIHPYRDPISRPLPRPVVCPENLDGREQAMEWFRAEFHVLLAVIGQAAADGHFSEHAWQLPWAVAMFLNWDGHWLELAATQEAALAAACRAGDHAGQAEAHRFLGLAYVRFGVLDEGTAHLVAVLELGKQLSSTTLQARAHLELGRVANVGGQSSDALQHAEQALGLYQAERYLPGEASALNAAGWSCVLLGRHREALRHCGKAVALNRELGNRSGEAATLDSLGYAHYQLGNYAHAVRCYQQSVDAFGDTDDAHHRAQALTHLGDAHRESGSTGAARRAWRQALTILEDLQHPDAERLRSRLS